MLVKDLLTELALGQQSIRGDDRACDIKRFEKFKGDWDFGLLTYGAFCQGDAYLMRDGCEEMCSLGILAMTVS